MSDEQTLIKLAEAVYALFSRTADSGPDGHWPGAPHPSWVTAALVLMSSPISRKPTQEQAAEIPEAFWSACGFANPPGGTGILCGTARVMREFQEPYTVPPLVQCFHELAFQRQWYCVSKAHKKAPTKARPTAKA